MRLGGFARTAGFRFKSSSARRRVHFFFAAPREFVTPFGLNQPGAKVALKVYVILTSGNEAGSAAVFVERPDSVQLAA